ncbi:histidine kinase [Xylanimonas cellulosilytica DSM 15894]|uniref:histidine kinase n=1 Tax=Xylanimonas cellulosilytica (strain DSM 15894 / JCM 12276 / CECT 5975 / KCTC 9989 / LMG 20990 / NBRC 107835 / XIL07) TaxID=446471 RepID=D1C0A6_XYLCX|nr:ATP-binding protein [Xylanimonas cellulosilytica]ACZ30295.1 histidine kinase [Xylanimonas cellulosilytica DSM 15894]
MTSDDRVGLLRGHTLLGRSLRGRVARLLTISAFLLCVVYGFAVIVLVRSNTFLDEFVPDPGNPEQIMHYDNARYGVRLLVVVLVVLAVGAVLLGRFVWKTLEHDVLLPLAELAATARAAAGGDLEREVPRIGVGEVAALAGDVELMRAELAAQLEELRTSHAETAEAHDQLRAQAAELERSNRDLEQFAYVASHDLQEPLRKVASFTQLLGKRYRGRLDENADQYIDFAVDGAKRMQRLIQDLLMFSRVGRAEVREETVDLDAVLDEVLAELADRVAAADATVTHDRLPVVQGDPTLLRLVLTNVVGNACKFRRPDVPARIHVGARDTGDAWHLSVTDNGIGIDPQYADRVFVIFQRLHAKEVYPGTGIGLALVQRIVEYHGGRAWVAPAPDGGTTVAWTLPHRRGPRRPASGSRPAEGIG